ncbi:kinase-like domain-containing protein [Rhizophagus irregularis DAOM 181602=DAOM 197198]|nr:kinase-like domain-containing protein [Rhizophagus irregularis DAOM 181602=DAOM 197198]
MSAEYLNELKIHWKFIDNTDGLSLRFYGITKDPETEEFMMILDVAHRLFSFNNLTKPVNSSIITSYLDDDDEDNQDSQLIDLEVSSSLLQL